MSGPNQVVHTLRNLPPPPCERGCPFLERCTQEHLSCFAFANYAVAGSLSEREPDDLPSHAMFVLHESDAAPRRAAAAMRLLNERRELCARLEPSA